MANNDIRMRVLLNVDGKNKVVDVSSSIKEQQESLKATKTKSDLLQRPLLRFGSISTISSQNRGALDGSLISFNSIKVRLRQRSQTSSKGVYSSFNPIKVRLRRIVGIKQYINSP